MSSTLERVLVGLPSPTGGTVCTLVLSCFNFARNLSRRCWPAGTTSEDERARLPCAPRACHAAMLLLEYNLSAKW